MAYIRETEEFDPETLHILSNALDEAWRRVKPNHLNGRAYGARTVLAQHIFAMAKQGQSLAPLVRWRSRLNLWRAQRMTKASILVRVGRNCV